MSTDRRTFLKGIGATLSLPLLESIAAAQPDQGTPLVRFLVVANPLGMYPEHFFPRQFGQDFDLPATLQPLDWLQDRLTVLSHTDHRMGGGHGKEISFLSGLLPNEAGAYPEKNISVDQVMARQTTGKVRFTSVGASLDSGIGASWNANGVEVKPFTDPHKLFDHLFLNLSDDEKAARRDLLSRNGSILDALCEQFASLRQRASRRDLNRLDQFQSSIRELETSYRNRNGWIDRGKPEFDISSHFSEKEATVRDRYNAIFDMLAYAFETDLTRVGVVAFSRDLSYLELDGVTRNYHACTHNGKRPDVVEELIKIESFQIEQMSRCLKKLDSIQEPDTDGSLLDNTIVLFGSGMGYGGSHSNRNLPIMVAGGGFQHRGHVDTRSSARTNMPLCNLYVTLLQRFGIERDQFNTSTGALELQHA